MSQTIGSYRRMDSPCRLWNSMKPRWQNLALKIPGLEISRQNMPGGVLSAKRIYLRVMRERLVF